MPNDFELTSDIQVKRKGPKPHHMVINEELVILMTRVTRPRHRLEYSQTREQPCAKVSSIILEVLAIEITIHSAAYPKSREEAVTSEKLLNARVRIARTKTQCQQQSHVSCKLQRPDRTSNSDKREFQCDALKRRAEAQSTANTRTQCHQGRTLCAASDS